MEKADRFSTSNKKELKMTEIKDVRWFVRELELFSGSDAEFSGGVRGPIHCIQVARCGDKFSICLETKWLAKYEREGWFVVSDHGRPTTMRDPTIELLNGKSVKLSLPGCPQFGFMVIQFAYANIVPVGKHPSFR